MILLQIICGFLISKEPDNGSHLWVSQTLGCHQWNNLAAASRILTFGSSHPVVATWHNQPTRFFFPQGWLNSGHGKKFGDHGLQKSTNSLALFGCICIHLNPHFCVLEHTWKLCIIILRRIQFTCIGVDWRWKLINLHPNTLRWIQVQPNKLLCGQYSITGAGQKI